MGRSYEKVITGALLLVEAGLLLLGESRSPLRRPREARETRFLRNGVLGGLAVAATVMLETPVVMRVAAVTGRRGWGLLPRLGFSPSVRTVASIALLDYGMYVWHAAMHRIPILWRLHVVHHADRDCDVTTAMRIHAVEIALSVAVHVAQVVSLGVTPREFAIWQRLFACSVLFHHANLQLPAGLDRVLGTLLMTPRRHGIHHLARRDAQHGNWSSGLVIWDWVHGTLRDGDSSGDVGVPAYRSEIDVTLRKMLALPFIPQPNAWCSR